MWVYIYPIAHQNIALMGGCFFIRSPTAAVSFFWGGFTVVQFIAWSLPSFGGAVFAGGSPAFVSPN